MDFDELVNNIRAARDQADADRVAFEQERDALDDQNIDSVGHRLRLTMDLVAADTVSAALSRILGEARTRPQQS